MKLLTLRESTLKVYLVKPQTYMNLSGPAVRDILNYHGMSTGESLEDSLLVIYDDMDLPEGRLRFRARGSSGGHRGLASLISSLGHERFSRLRIGIGRGEADEPSDYVLESLNRATRERLEMAADAASEALIPWLEEGIECSMNCFNAVAAPEPEQDEPTNES